MALQPYDIPQVLSAATLAAPWNNDFGGPTGWVQYWNSYNASHPFKFPFGTLAWHTSDPYALSLDYLFLVNPNNEWRTQAWDPGFEDTNKWLHTSIYQLISLLDAAIGNTATGLSSWQRIAPYVYWNKARDFNWLPSHGLVRIRMLGLDIKPNTNMTTYEWLTTDPNAIASERQYILDSGGYAGFVKLTSRLGQLASATANLIAITQETFNAMAQGPVAISYYVNSQLVRNHNWNPSLPATPAPISIPKAPVVVTAQPINTNDQGKVGGDLSDPNNPVDCCGNPANGDYDTGTCFPCGNSSTVTHSVSPAIPTITGDNSTPDDSQSSGQYMCVNPLVTKSARSVATVSTDCNAGAAPVNNAVSNVAATSGVSTGVLVGGALLLLLLLGKK